MEYCEFRAMNSDIILAAEGTHESIARGFDQAQALVRALETRLTRFSDTSELARLNRSAGSRFSASRELYALVRQAYDFVNETDGLFDPTILGALENAGYDRSMDDMARGARGVTRQAARSLKWDASNISFDPHARTIRLPRGMRLDLGGIAKGWIAERVAHGLAKYAEACAVSAGGDMFMIGLPAQETAWPIELEDPHDPAQTLAVLRVPPGAVATSSITKRRWLQAGHMQHHLIDPRTGLPAETDWLSVTVIAPRATVAEVFAKALLIAGSSQAQHIATRRSDLVYFAVDRTGQLWGSTNAKEFLDVATEYA